MLAAWISPSIGSP